MLRRALPPLVALLACCSPPPAPPPSPPTTVTLAQSAAPAITAVTQAPPPASAEPAPGPCPADMVDVSLACIDRYEAPNVAGEKPLVMQNLDDAKAWCSAHGKRLCTEDEWMRACRGPKGTRYPYGDTYDEHACNHDKGYRAPRWGTLGHWPAEDAKAEAARLDQSEPSGARDRCVSAEGVHDLTGNAAEWVTRTRPHPEACETSEQKAHQHVVVGCGWGKCFRAPHEPSCEYVNCAHADGFRSYEFGFRCCKDRGP